MITSKFLDYEMEYFYRPGKTLPPADCFLIHDVIKEINNKSYKFNYGLFDPEISNDKIVNLFSDFLICIIKIQGEAVGFFYFHILNENRKIPLVQLGLVVILKNIGINILSISERIAMALMYKNIGSYKCSVITTIPKIVEEFCGIFSSPWPSPYANLLRAPSENKEYLDDVGEKYIKTFFPKPFKINKRRYTLILDKRESGFHDKFFDLPMARNFIFNSFCSSWINYEEGEDLILIGEYNFLANLKNHCFLKLEKIKWNCLGKRSLLIPKPNKK